MPRTALATNDTPGARPTPLSTVTPPRPAPGTGRTGTKHPGQPESSPPRFLSDDEILDLPLVGREQARPDEGDINEAQAELDFDGSVADARSGSGNRDTQAESVGAPEHLRATLDAHPELRQAWQDAEAYRQTFRTPEEARAATAGLADLDRLEALFFSQRPEDHVELARVIASLDSAAFNSLVQAMSGLATEARMHRGDQRGQHGSTEAEKQGGALTETTSALSVPHGSDKISNPAIQPAAQESGARSDAVEQNQTSGPPQESRPQSDRGATSVSPATVEFFHATNAAAVESVLDAIQSEVTRLLPERVSTNARNRLVGEIYRELDTTLQANRQLTAQLRDAFQSGALDTAHQRAIVSLISSRARQALPAVAKRVLNEWTSTVVSANQDRRARQRAAERRVDIAGSGGASHDGQRALTPRDIDYARLSDADILNL